MSDLSNRPAMYFKTLTLENIKCFGERQTLDLTKDGITISPWTLILGNNGTGKTTVLKSLAWMRPVQSPEPVEGGVMLKPFMDDLEDESQFNQLIRVGENRAASIEATFSIGSDLGQAPEVNALASTGMLFERIAGKLEKVSPVTFTLPAFNTLNLFAYGANRHMGYKNYDQSSLKNDIFNLFSDSGDLYDAEQVLSSLEYASLKETGQGKATALFNKVKQIMADLLPDIPDPESFFIHSPVSRDGVLQESYVEVRTPYGEVPLYELSLGYKTMLAWSTDLAIRMIWQNPELPDPLEQPAVVLIDEIDLHLHPTWQRSVREYLVRHFPRTQFICTAHSPFMAQSSEKENLCVLHREGNTVIIENDPLVVQGWRIGQVATSNLFGVDSERSPEVEALLNKRRSILDKPARSPADEEALKRLDADLSGLPVTENGEDQVLLDQIHAAAELLKAKGKLP